MAGKYIGIWQPPGGGEPVRLEAESEKELKRMAAQKSREFATMARAQPSIVVPPQESTLRDKGRAFAQGGTLGFQDEIQAGIGAGLDVVGGLAPADQFMQQYRLHRDDERLAQNAYAIQHPKENFALQMAGGLALPGGSAVRGVAKAPSWGRTARVGAGYGGAAGWGTGEGGPIEQGLQAATGAAIGGPLGLATPFMAQAVGTGAKLGTQAVGSKIRNLVGKTDVEAELTGVAGPNRGQLMTQAHQAAEGMEQSPVLGQERKRLIKRAEEIGIQLTPGERNDSMQLRQFEAAQRSSPMSPVGYQLHKTRGGNRRRVNDLVGEVIGTPAGGEMSAPLVAHRARIVGNKLDWVERQLGDMRIDNQARRELNELRNTASDPLVHNPEGEAEIARLQSVQDFNQPISGERLARMRTKYGNKAHEAWTKGDATMGEFYDSLVETFDGIVDRQVARSSGKFTSKQRVPEIWAEARAQWKVIRALRKPGVVQDGNVKAGRLASEMAKSDKSGYRDMGTIGKKGAKADLYDALRIHEYFGDVVGDSGTATRSAYNALAQDTIPRMALRAAASFGSRPLGAAYMRHGVAGLAQPNALGRGAYGSTIGALSSNRAIQGGIYGDEDDGE